MRKSIFLLLATVTISLGIKGQTKNVLFLGNSYTSVNNLPLLVSDLAESLGDTVVYSAYTPGAYTFEGHSTNATSLAKIGEGIWDYVVLQEQSQRPSFPPSQVSQEVYPYADILVDSILSANPCTEPLFYMTWGRKNGDTQNCQFYAPICTYDGMQARLRESYLEMSVDNSCSVSPVGAAWKYMRDNYPNIELYSADESHPSINGSYLAACVHYASIFRKSPSGASFISSVSAGDALIMQDVSEMIVLDSLDNWRIDENDLVAEYDYTVNSSSVNFSENGLNATSYLWDLGDGNTSTQQIFTHAYSQDGAYNVELIVENDCDSDTIIKEIVIGTTGINEVSSEYSLLKVGNQYSIKFSNKEKRKISLFDVKGSLISTKESSNEVVTLELPHAGIYFISIVGNNYQDAFKLFQED